MWDSCEGHVSRTIGNKEGVVRWLPHDLTDGYGHDL